MTAKYQPIVSLPPDPALRASVAIAVSSNSPDLERALNALAVQTDTRDRPLSPHQYEVILLLANCQELEISSRFRLEQPWFRLHVVRCGSAGTQAGSGQLRRAAMDEACRRLLRIGNKRGLILTTDADAEVARDWIARNLAEIESGADAVGGRILLDPGKSDNLTEDTRAVHDLDERYQLLLATLEHHYDPLPFDPLPRHHHHSPTSIAVTAEAYSNIGGFPASALAKRGAWYEALLEQDIRFRHSPAVTVFTPRLPGLWSAYLAAQITGYPLHPGQGERLPVESVEFYEDFFQSRRRMRRLWQSGQEGRVSIPAAVSELADLIAVPSPVLREFLSDSPTFGQFLAWSKLRRRVEKRWQNRGRFEPLALAVDKLEQRFAPTPAQRKKINFGVRSITVTPHL
jgi:hypothetical protein